MVFCPQMNESRASSDGRDASSQSLVAGADDRVFRLDRAGLDQCQSLVTVRKELAAIRHK
jgi:hypothetical protein